MVGIAQGYEIWVIGVIIFHKYTFILKTDDCDAVLVVFCEGGDSKSESRSRSKLLTGCGRFAPVETVHRPL